MDTSAQCTLTSMSHKGTEVVYISAVTGGAQEFTVLETKISLTGKRLAKAFYWDWCRGSMDTWYWLPQKRVFYILVRKIHDLFGA